MKAILTRSLALLGLTSIFALTGCQDEDFGYTAEEISFNTNFQKEYGKIDPEQSWDFYRAKPRTAKFSPWMHGEAETRAGIPGYTQTDASAIIKNSGSNAYYDVLDETLDWMRANLVEEHNNTSVGEPFSLLPPPHNDFAIIPIYVGQHTMDVSLHLVSDGKDYKIWSEWEGDTGVQVKDNATADWRTLKSNQNTLSAYDVQAKPIMINHEVVTKEFFFYLSIDKGHMKNENGYSGYEYSDGNYAITGTAQRSDEGMMLALGCPIPENISSTGERQNEVMIIGCEDSDQANSDWDINDLVFLIVGYPDIPNLVEYTRKRYMCEDLGNTFDFDFNDIVVDVDQEIVKEAKISQDGTMIVFEEEAGSRKQYATIKHVCGTLPFQVKVGDFTFNKVYDPTDEDRTRQDLGASDTRGVNWNPDVCKKITGWKPEENNIWITVQDARTNPDSYVFTDLFAASVENENAAEHIYRVNFPKDGTPPMILALDQSVQWMDENVHIPESWWKDGKIFRKTLNLISNPAGAGTFIGAGSYLYGSKVHFSVRANEGYVFTGWSDNNTEITREITSLNDNTTLTANFRESQHVTVSWSADPAENSTITATTQGEAVESGTSFIEGATIHFNATTESSSLEFANWKIGDNIVSTRPDFDYVIDGAGSSSVQLTAHFAAPWWDVELTPADDGGKNVWSGVHNANDYTQYNELSDEGMNNGEHRDGLKKLIKSLKEGNRYIKFEFSDKVSGNFQIRYANWVELQYVEMSNKGYYILHLTEEQAQKIIETNGIRIEFKLNGGAKIAAVKAYDLEPVVGFTVEVASEPNGTATASASSGESGDPITLTATANDGYVFQGWKNADDEIVSTANPWTFNISTNVSYTATFRQAEQYNVTITAGEHGMIKVNGGEAVSEFTAANVYEGTRYTVEAVGDDGYAFEMWSDNNSTTNPRTFTVNGGNLEVVALFKEKPAGPDYGTKVSKIENSDSNFTYDIDKDCFSSASSKISITLVQESNGAYNIVYTERGTYTELVNFGYSTDLVKTVEITDAAKIATIKEKGLSCRNYGSADPDVYIKCE